MKIKITNSEPKLVSFWDIYGKELEVKDTKTVQFASGPKTYYIADFEGREYEVPEDMVEKRTNKELSEYYWKKAEAIEEEMASDSGGETSGMNYERLERLQKEMDYYRNLSIELDGKAGRGKRVEDIKVGDVVEFIEPEEEEEGVTYNVLELRGDRVLVNDNINTEMEVRPTYVYLINDLKKVDKAGKGKMIYKLGDLIVRHDDPSEFYKLNKIATGSFEISKLDRYGKPKNFLNIPHDLQTSDVYRIAGEEEIMEFENGLSDEFAGTGTRVKRVGIYTDEKLEELAKRHFPSLETLQTRKSDSLDFHDLSVWQIKSALKEAGRDMLSDSELLEIAKNHLYLDTLKTRNSDELDFSEQAVWALKDALKEANYKGVEKLRKAGNGSKTPNKSYSYLGVFDTNNKLFMAFRYAIVDGAVQNSASIDKIMDFVLKNNYSVRKITKEEYESAPSYFDNEKNKGKAGDGTKIEKMEIKNQYDGKSPEQVWDAWTKHQREHFCIDHNLMDNMSVRQFKMSSSELKNEIWGKEFRNVNTWDYWILPTLADHVVVGQYGKGGPIPENKYYYLPIGRIFKDSGGVRFQISGYTPEALKIKRYSEVEKDTAEAELSFGAVPTLAEDKKITFEGATLETWRDMRLLELEIDSIKKHLALADTRKTYQSELEQAADKIDKLNAELVQVKREADTLLNDVQKTKASAKDSLDAMEAIARKTKAKAPTNRDVPKEIDEAITRKPSTWNEVDEIDSTLVQKHIKFFKALPEYTLSIIGPPFKDLGIDYTEPFIGRLNKKVYLIVPEGYKYARYAGDITDAWTVGGKAGKGKMVDPEITKGDFVKVLRGQYKGQTGQVEEADENQIDVMMGDGNIRFLGHDDVKKIAGKGTHVSPCSDCDTKLKAFIAKFPNNAKSWAQATDEMRDLARELREYYNDINDISEGQKGYIDGLPFKEFKTPSEWNTKAKKQILSTWKKLSKEQKQQFAESNSFLNPDND